MTALYPTEPGAKCCTGCNALKPLSEFHRDPHHPTGYVSRCKECKKAYYRANASTLIAVAAQWQKANPARANASTRTWQKKHPNKQITTPAQSRRKYLALRADPDRYANVLAKQAEWRRANPDKKKVWKSQYRARLVNSDGSFTAAEFHALCEIHGFTCLCCGNKKPLTPDHVVPLSKGGSNAIENIQPLCGSCNSSKGAKTIDYRT